MPTPASSESQPQPHEQMEAMLQGHFVAQCLHATAVLGIPDLIEQGHSSVDELAFATKTNQPSLNRLLRTLASLGVLRDEAEGKFSLTDLGATLRTDAPDSVRDKAIFEISPPIWSVWGSFLDSLHRGQASFLQVA